MRLFLPQTRTEGVYKSRGYSEFITAFMATLTLNVKPKAGTLQSVLSGFQESSEWHDLAVRTQKD
jgi:hypothetical protein